jgi:hypothetical protein
MRAIPTCPECGGVGVPGHRCPRACACIDCGRPADMFVPNANALALEESEMLKEVAQGAPTDQALCDECFYNRCRIQTARRRN